MTAAENLNVVRAGAKRVAPYLAIHLLGLALVATLVPYWRDADMFLFAALNHRAAAQMSSDIVIIDVRQPRDKDEEKYRRTIAALLETLAAHPDRPKTVSLDLWFQKGNERGLEAIVSAVEKLRAKDCGIKVEAAVNPQLSLDEHARRLYDAAFDGFGHSLLFYDFDTVWYQPRIKLDANSSLPSLPLMIAEEGESCDGSGRKHLQLPGYVIIALGASAATLQQTFSFQPGQEPGQPGKFYRFASLSAGSGEQAQPRFNGKHIIIGDLINDRKNPLNRPGPEILAWALNDYIQPDPGRHELLANPFLLITLVLAFSALAGGLFLLLFRHYKTPPERLWRLFLASSLASIGVFVVLVACLMLVRRTYPQMSLVIFGVLLASALSWHYWQRRFWNDLFDPSKAEPTAGELRYDVFISYSREATNAAWAAQHVCARLEKEIPGVRVFFDKTDLTAEAWWFWKLGEAIIANEIFVAVYSPEHFKSNFCLWEIRTALRKKIHHDDFQIYPVRRGAPEVPFMFSEIQYCDAETDTTCLPGLIELVRKSMARGSNHAPTVAAEAKS